jgi:ABC-type Fe3+/spermidine/putrescine transport system ATPase subunit
LELRIERVSKRFGEVTAVNDLSFEAEKGSFVTLLGPSGSGKTTVLRCIAGVETPDSGTIEIGGKVVFSKKDHIAVPPEQRELGMVYQSYALWPHMSVFDNVAYPLKVRGSMEGVAERVDKILKTLKMETMKMRFPYQLSGGEQQRVAFARALVYEPKVLLLDEPFSNLDTPLREKLRDELKIVQRETGITTVYVTHHRIEASSLSDRIVVLFNGKVSGMGAPSDLLEHPPNRELAIFLGGFLVLEGVLHRSSEAKTLVRTPYGELEVEGPGKASEEGSIEVYVKPSLTRLTRDDRGPNKIQGKVVGLTRDATSLEYHVAVGDQVIKVLHDAGGGWQPVMEETVFVETLPGASILA